MSKEQQYLQVRLVVRRGGKIHPGCVYTRKLSFAHVAPSSWASRHGLKLAGSGSGRLQGDVEMLWTECVCHRCSNAAIDGTEHMIVSCPILTTYKCWCHQSYFTHIPRSFSAFMVR